MAGLIRKVTPRTVPGTPGFGNVPKPQISMPPKVTKTPKPVPKNTKKNTPKITSAPKPTATPSVTVSRNPEYRGSFPPVANKAPRPKTTAKPVTPKPTPKVTATPKATPKPKKTTKPKGATGSIFG